MAKMSNFKKQHIESMVHSHHILEMLANNSSTFNILEELVSILEHAIPNSMCYIYLKNNNRNILDNGIGPNLPKKYIQSIGSIKVGPEAGACGRAAFYKKNIIVSDISTSPLWKEYKPLALGYGLKACWSIPIFSPTNKVVGTIAVYFTKKYSPDSTEWKRIEPYIKLAGIVIDYKQSELEIEQIRQYDSVTGLPNAIKFKQDVKQVLDQSQLRKEQSKFAIVFLDLDRFNVINTLGGYQFGDIVLKKVAKTISQSLGEYSLITRWNSDKFICLIPYTFNKDIQANISTILNNLHKPLEIEQHEFFIKTSIGISCYPKDGTDVELLVKNAELAMKEAKSKGENKCIYYTSSMNANLSEQIIIEKDLRHAINRNEFLLYYQPQLDLSNNQIVGLEALIRWQHPNLQLMAPDKFMKVAEETELIIPIGEWVLRTACNQMNFLKTKGYPCRLSVNLSSIQFLQDNLVDMVQDVITESGIDPNNLVLEVTESTLVENLDVTVDQLKRLKSIGVQIALDDFGTLYSSLNYLKHFPIDIIKIDKSFVRNSASDKRDIEILKTIIRLGKNLKLKVLAEGIETKNQLEMLKALDCEEGQGYLFSRPLAMEEFIKNLYTVGNGM
ncbi:EAL domain-containing protein [Aquibacillus albus]|uniref:Diguanylate cyclase (GGDEF)-like protein n=1 Tax=Aquibacillus albus TaxID=1168171 RepID=A0ABS2N3J3_9BACI|nr:EAL domain-containing protein [Aquibacillus albus]MBM7572707.1 diguanylate cyclase (GGDEF)-like protein [Aquibacillus albus]